MRWYKQIVHDGRLLGVVVMLQVVAMAMVFVAVINGRR
jgi:hypothetical protein